MFGLKKVNGISKLDLYPMPRIHDLVERIGGSSYISTLDLSRGYWQVPLTSESREIMAFRTPFGNFRSRFFPLVFMVPPLLSSA